MKKKRLVFLGCALVTLVAMSWAADFIYVPWLDAYADRATLFLRWGLSGENIALQVSLGDSAIGIQFGETMDDTAKLNVAKGRLLRLLKTKDFDLDDLPTSLGLTFVQFIRYENVIPNVIK